MDPGGEDGWRGGMDENVSDERKTIGSEKLNTCWMGRCGDNGK
jgi:hypothetical protein